MPLPNFPSPWMTEEHVALQDSVRRYIAERWVPRAAEFRTEGRMGPAVWREAAENGLLCVSTPEAYGGGGGDFGHEAVILLEQARANLSGWGGGLHSAIVAPYILHYGTEAQKQRWLPKMCRGEFITAIAMTEPGTGSDLQAVRTRARRDGDHYVLSGAKTFITNGGNANLICVVCRTGDDGSPGAKGVSLLMLETEGAEGFRRGRILEKIGMKAQDTAELFFDNVRVPAANLLGEEHRGFSYLMQELPWERLQIAIGAIASAEGALDWTLRYVRERQAFGKPVIDFQTARHTLAELKTEVQIGRVFVDRCIELKLAGKLDAATASMAKYWTTDLQFKVMDRCVQLHGGYGYMWEYPIARAWADSRVQQIYGGTNEIMKELIARTL
jgi:acyl-CoA dehydrogenase